MTTPHDTPRDIAGSETTTAGSSNRLAQTDGRPQRMPPLMRRVEVVHLASPTSLEIREISRIVPATPIFEEAFSAFARGTILQTDRGLTSVEDLLPGDKVRTADDGFQTLIWRGATILSPNAPRQDPVMGKLTRIAADALGIARPMPDLVLGPKARIIHRGDGVRTLTGSRIAAVPARDFIDGNNVIELTPPTTVPVYHIGFEGHHLVLANGVEIESFHPGPAHMIGLRGELLQVYLSCFPHVSTIEEFGLPAMPRLRLGDLDLFDVA